MLRLKLWTSFDERLFLLGLYLDKCDEIFLSYVNKAFDLEKKKTAREFLNVFSAMYDDYSNYVLQDKWYVLDNM